MLPPLTRRRQRRIQAAQRRLDPGYLWQFDTQGDVAMSPAINGLDGEAWERANTTTGIQPTDSAVTNDPHWELDANEDLQPVE